jgi:hypothetical protein
VTTANDLITRAFRRGRVIGKDETPAADEAADALAELNDMLDTWWIDKLAVFRILSEQFTLVVGQQTYTIGTGGNFNTTRPVKIVPGCYYTLNGIDRQLTVLTDRKSWDEIPYKSLSAPPQALFYDEAYPTGNVLFYPTPDVAYTVHINSWSRLQNIAGLTTAIALPPGYNSLIVNGLAIAICPEYGLEAPASVVRAFNRTYRLLSLVNYELPVLGYPGSVLPRQAGGANILTGETSVIVPLIGAGVKSKSAVVSAQRRLNVYLEPQRDQDKTPIAVYGTPGLTKVMDEGALPFRGGVAVGDTLYVARGNIFESVNNAFVSTDLNAASRLTTNTGRISMATNELVIVLVDGTNGYIYDITAGTFAQIASAMFASPQTVTYQDGYFLATFLETGTNKKRCQISADGVTWNALDYRAIDTTPGALMRSLSFGGEVHQFADKGLEFWAYTGDPTFPWAPIRGATIPIGLAARWSVALGENSLFFLGRDRGGSGVQVYELAGHSVRSISTPDLSDAINKYGTLGDATGAFYSEDEHNFFVLSFPAAGKTWMYDGFASEVVGTPVWSELSSSGGRHLIDLIFPLVNKAYATDYGAARIYLIDETAYTDNGASIRREVDTRHFFKDYDRVTVDEIVADMETGVGLAVGQGVDPQVMIQISRDGGRTFGAEIWHTLGAVGAYKTRIAQRRCGTARDFVFRIAMTDPVKFVMAGLSVRASAEQPRQIARV